jgi:POT family proton-dependent oligopeptide transporter
MSTTTTDAHLNKNLLVTQLDYLYYFLPKCGSVFILWDESLLVLYMTSSTLGDDARGAGLGWTKEALALYGWYTMLVYIMSIPGGMIADRS